MPKAKAKHDSLSSDSRWLFVGLWVASYGFSWAAVIFLMIRAVAFSTISNDLANILAVSGILLLTGLLHSQIIERLFKRSMSGWMQSTLAGTIITVFAFSAVQTTDMSSTLTAFSLLMPVPLVQTVWLMKRVRSAWSWPLLSLVFCLVFVLLLKGLHIELIGGFWMALVYGLFQGIVIHHLLSHSRDTEKAKVDFAIDENDEYERMKRLQESEHRNSSWDVDEQALQTDSNM